MTAGTLTPTAIGGFTEGAKSSRLTWCSARQLSMSETLSYGLETATATYQFSFLYYSADDLTRIKEVIYESRNFRVLQVKEVNEEKKEVQIIAAERL